MSAPSSPKGKYWVFTLNNPRISALQFIELLEPHVDYAVFQREEGEENHTPHFQGYVCLKNRKELRWLKRHVSDRASWRRRRGTHAEAKTYCEKPEGRLSGPHYVGDDSGRCHDCAYCKWNDC